MPGGRVLMIAHHFPPGSGSGANRMLAFARYLPEYHWQPTVLTPGLTWAMNPDPALMAQVPQSVRVIRTRSFEPRPRAAPGAAYAFGQGKDSARVSALRAHLGHLRRFPDAHVGWLPFALAAARRQSHDLAYSTSGPFTSHLVGLLLKRGTGKPWVAELRDGWYRWNRAIFPDYPRWRGALERRLEAAAVRHADRVVLVTERMAEAFRWHYPDLPADHFSVVSNGFDPGQVGPEAGRGQGARPKTNPGAQRLFNVVHTGALYYGRSLAAFLDAAQRLVDSDPAFARAFRLTLLGTLDAAARHEVSRHALADRLICNGQVDHAAALAAMAAADLLLLVANTTPGAEATVPGKLFEYLAIGKPILAIAPRDSSTRDVLDQTGGGLVAPAGDTAAITAALRQAFAQHQAATPGAPDLTEVARFDRRVLAGDLARIFDHVHAPRV